MLDWIAALGAPALLVVGSYLGTLSHSLTAAAALRERGVTLRGRRRQRVGRATGAGGRDGSDARPIRSAVPFVYCRERAGAPLGDYQGAPLLPLLDAISPKRCRCYGFGST